MNGRSLEHETRNLFHRATLFNLLFGEKNGVVSPESYYLPIECLKFSMLAEPGAYRVRVCIHFKNIKRISEPTSTRALGISPHVQRCDEGRWGGCSTP